MSLFKSKSPKSLQKEYVEKRQRQLFKNDDAKTAAVKKKLIELGARQTPKVVVTDADWLDVYTTITYALQAANLTINLEADAWFAKENRYPTYSSVYARGVQPGGKMQLNDSDPLNPIAVRAMADDLVTVPEEWGHAHRFSQRKRLHNALTTTGSTQADKMRYDKAGAGSKPLDVHPKLEQNATGQYTTKNRHFKPAAKQVFAALNYGRRQHGASTVYGYSYLVLKPAIKEGAIYFPGDTFFTTARGTTHQATYFTLGALLEFASPKLGNDIWASCYEGKVLASVAAIDELLEAHVFQEVRVDRDVAALVLSRTRKKKTGEAPPQPWTDAEWQNILANATTWCKANGGISLALAAS